MDGNIFERMNMQQICSFILYCNTKPSSENLTYKERLKNGSRVIYKRLKRICKNEEEYEDAVIDLLEAFTAYEEVFTEIGMKSGARIVLQLLQDDCAEFSSKKVHNLDY